MNCSNLDNFSVLPLGHFLAPCSHLGCIVIDIAFFTQPIESVNASIHNATNFNLIVIEFVSKFGQIDFMIAGNIGGPSNRGLASRDVLKHFH